MHPELNTLVLWMIASCMLLAAHGLRAWRWAILFPAPYLRNRLDLLTGLVAGYCVNAVLPFRVGELLRSSLVSRKTGVRFSFVAASVVAERTTDAAAMSIIFGIFCLTGQALLGVSIMYLTLFSLSVIFSVMIKKSVIFRLLIWNHASVFNDRIRTDILDFCWSVSEIISGRSIRGKYFVLLTLVMWSLYAASYTVFSIACSSTLPDIIHMLLGSPFISLEGQLIGTRQNWEILFFMLFPVCGTLIYGSIKTLIPALVSLTRFGYGIPSSADTVREHYRMDTEHRMFLNSLFSGGDTGIAHFGLQAIGDGMVNRFYTGGSGAVTALVEVGETLLVRKFGIGEAGEKLRIQAEWMKKNRGGALPMPEVLNPLSSSEFFRYDMPGRPSVDFYDYIHTSARSESIILLTSMLKAVSAFHAVLGKTDADDTTVKNYISEKIFANTDTIIQFIRPLLPDVFMINGVEYSLSEWSDLKDEAWCMKQITSRKTCNVHGDFTVENLIIDQGSSEGWYTIDPNSYNVFNTPLIDYSKLMQSFHLGYESINRIPRCNLSGNSISLQLPRSQAYGDMHPVLENFILTEFGEDALRETYFHELVNYLRLVPYKIRHDTTKGLCFFACTCILIRRYKDKYLR